MDARRLAKYIKYARTKGTPTYYLRNYVALGVVSVGGVIGVAIHYSPMGDKVRRRIAEGYYDDPPEEKLRDRMFFFTHKPLPSHDLYKDLQTPKEEFD